MVQNLGGPSMVSVAQMGPIVYTGATFSKHSTAFTVTMK